MATGTCVSVELFGFKLSTAALEEHREAELPSAQWFLVMHSDEHLCYVNKEILFNHQGVDASM